jgi:hypothetical protein
VEVVLMVWELFGTLAPLGAGGRLRSARNRGVEAIPFLEMDVVSGRGVRVEGAEMENADRRAGGAEVRF